MTDTDYESVRQLIERVPGAAFADHRDVSWFTSAHVVGVARDQLGRIEVFLLGSELNPISAVVAEAIEFHTWHRDSGPPMKANRILLPALGHFDQVAAFICTELLRNGADDSLARAFVRTEPLIEIVIERLRLSDRAIVGLAGELLLLDALCRRGEDAAIAHILDSWAGWRRSARDFSLGSAGVEVKTTTGSTSSHFVEGVHQVEPSDGSTGGTPESRLYLVSIGLEVAVSGGNAFALPQLVDRIVDRMKATGNGAAVDKFLSHVLEYGADSGAGYDHASPAVDPAYLTPFLTTFFRSYNMASEAVQVLRRRDVTSRPHVDVNFVKFRIELPVVAGHSNPTNGPNQVADAILGSRA